MAHRHHTVGATDDEDEQFNDADQYTCIHQSKMQDMNKAWIDFLVAIQESTLYVKKKD